MGCYQTSAELDDELITRIRRVGAGKHLKHAGQGPTGPGWKNTHRLFGGQETVMSEVTENEVKKEK